MRITISGWVNGADARSEPLNEADARQRLLLLSQNAINSIKTNKYYPASLVDQIEFIVSDSEGGSQAELLARLREQLRANLVAGSYIRP